MRPSLFLFVLISPILVLCQQPPTDVKAKDEKLPAAYLSTIGFSVQLPGGDMAKRYYENYNFSYQGSFLTSSNWMFSFELEYLFNERIRENPISNLFTNEGYIINQFGEPGMVSLQMKGFYAGGRVARIVSFSKKQPRSGIELGLGMGFFQHKIDVKDFSGDILALSGENAKGYDKLANGVALRPSVGYRLLSKNKYLNFYVGFDLTMGFTQGRRNWHFDTRTPGTDKRLDLLYGFKVAWTLPIYFYNKKNSGEFYY